MEENKSDYFTESIWSDIPPSIQESRDIFTEDNDRPFSEAYEQEPLQLESFDDYVSSQASSKPKNMPRRPPVNPIKKISSFGKMKKECKLTADVSDEDSVSECPPSAKIKTLEQQKAPKPQKKRRKRRDVIFKKILRECRRFFQTKLTDLTGFIASKKPRKDDYMYVCMQRFNRESLQKEGTFAENFYLACLLYPQDLARNIDSFLAKLETEDREAARKKYKAIIHKIHDTLYKYSHDKLDFFVSKHELSALFCYFYQEGAGEDKSDPKYVEEYEFIKNKCFDALNRLTVSH